MKAAIHTKFGPPEVIQIRNIEKPVHGNKELLIRVYAATFNRTDCANVSAKPWFMLFTQGLIRPKHPVSGTDFAGIVETVGKDVTGFKPGDRIFGFDDSGLQSHAEFMTYSADNALAVMPADVSFAEAAASLEGAHYAYNFITKVQLQKGQRAMVNGATGAIGSAMVQLLKYYGLGIAATCGTDHADLVKNLGAGLVLDYTRDDFTRIDEQFDYVFDCVGKSTFGKCKNILKPQGIYISSEMGPGAQNMYLPLFTAMGRGRKIKSPIPLNRMRTIRLMKKLIEEGHFNAVIEKTYTLDETANAYAHAASGQKIGHVVIRLADEK
ncbi:MAG: NAD(P)-dependent alcohol dehydrogenase [bacterium]